MNKTKLQTQKHKQVSFKQFKQHTFNIKANIYSIKKKVLCYFILLTTINCLYAQNTDKVDVFSLSTGLALPVADFSKKSFVTDAGFAYPGANIEFEYYKYRKPFFALNFNTTYSAMFFAKGKFKDEYYKALPQTNGLEFTTGNYHILKIEPGLVLKFPKKNNLEFLFPFRLGCSMVLHPELKVTDNSLGELKYIKKQLSAWISFSTGMKVNYYLSDKHGLSFSCNLSYSKPGFGDSTVYQGHFNLPITYSNINVGLFFSL